MIQQKQDRRVQLETKMRGCKRGDVIPLNQLAATLGLSIDTTVPHSTTPAYAIARRAAKFIEDETNGHLVFRWDREKGGWRALHAEEIPSQSDLQLKGIRKSAKRTSRMAQAAMVDGVSLPSERRLIVNMTLANAVATFASRSVAKQTINMIPGVGHLTEEAALNALRARGS